MLNKFCIFAVIVAGALVGFIDADSCIDCNSANDNNCVIAPWLARTQTCNGRCYSRIVDGHTLRGCSDGLDERVVANCDAGTNCLLCPSLGGGSCNNEIYPPHRLQCHQCVGGLTSNCSGIITTNAQPCGLFNNEDSCYIHKTANTVERGCLSSSGNRCSNIAHCYICNGHGCNSLNTTDTQVPTAPNSAAIMRPILPIFVVICVSLIFAKN